MPGNVKRSVGEFAADLETQIAIFTSEHGKTLDYMKSTTSLASASSGPIQNSSSSPARTPARTHVRPDFTDTELAGPLKRDQVWGPDLLTVDEFDNAKKFLGCKYSDCA